MRASAYNPTTNKRVYGEVLQNGFSNITLITTDNNGSRKIKQFNKQKWIIHIAAE